MNSFDPDAAARQVLGTIGAEAFVASYLAMPSEPSTALLPAHAAPRLLPDDDLELVPMGALQPGLHGTTEPAGEAIPWSLADVVIVPALAVAHSGVRLGRGGGSYDRALARVRPDCRVIALLAFDDEWRAELPTEAHDLRVTHVATPGGMEEVRPLLR